MSFDAQGRRLVPPTQPDMPEDFNERRDSARWNSQAPVYDDGVLTRGRTLDAVDNPIEYDPQARQQAFESMGSTLKNEFQRIRGGSREVFVEKSTPRAPNTANSTGPSTIKEARRMMYAASPARANRASNSGTSPRSTRQMSNRPRYPQYEDPEDYYEDDLYDETPGSEDEEDEFDPDEDEDDTYVTPRRPVRRQPYAPVQPPARPRLEERTDRRPPRRRPDDVSRNQRATNRPPSTRTLQNAPAVPGRRKPNSSSVAALQANQAARATPTAPDRRTTARNAPAPDPQFLAPDGTIPKTRPCEDYYIVHIQGPDGHPHRVVVECMEERRTLTAPYHQNMPHIARINDPRSNATGYFIWYHAGEEPR